jgi:hypothetical protein
MGIVFDDIADKFKPHSQEVRNDLKKIEDWIVANPSLAGVPSEFVFVLADNLLTLFFR